MNPWPLRQAWRDADSTRAIAAAVLATLEGARKAAPEALVPELATLLAKK